MGHVTFNGLTLLTAPGSVMTPRSGSVQLVAEACERLKGTSARVADVGTGNGVIAIAIARACPNVEIWATDINHSAIVLARANVRRNGLEHRVVVSRSDLLETVPAPLDMIVANLPYLPASSAAEYPDLCTEPFDAVFAPGDGLGEYRRLVDEASNWLADDGTLLLQLHRRVFAATRAELPALRAALGSELVVQAA